MCQLERQHPEGALTLLWVLPPGERTYSAPVPSSLPVSPVEKREAEKWKWQPKDTNLLQDWDLIIGLQNTSPSSTATSPSTQFLYNYRGLLLTYNWNHIKLHINCLWNISQIQAPLPFLSHSYDFSADSYLFCELVSYLPKGLPCQFSKLAPQKSLWIVYLLTAHGSCCVWQGGDEEAV